MEINNNEIDNSNGDKPRTNSIKSQNKEKEINFERNNKNNRNKGDEDY